MASMKLLLVVFGFSSFLSAAHASKILFLLPLSSLSHKNVFTPLYQELAKRGHEVTVVSPFPPKKVLQNVKEVVMEEAHSTLNAFSSQLFEDDKLSVGDRISMFTGMIGQSCEVYLNHSETKAMLKRGLQFDLVVVSQFMNDCALATSVLLGKHVAYLSPATHMPWVYSSSLPMPPSYVPLIGVPGISPDAKMTFFQRMTNSIASVAMPVIKVMFSDPIVNDLLGKYVPEAPTVADAEKRICFTLLNAEPVFQSVRPSIPNVVDVGGMHCQQAQPLPKDFEEFVSSSGDEGVVMFGLGSNAQSKFLPVETKQAFLSAFQRLKQKVIWKYEEQLDNLPKNLKITKWMPQQDLLGHPKVRLFITHGGLLSLQEAAYHGVPVIGTPIFADQPANVKKATELGLGEAFDLRNITADIIYDKITKVLNDPKYTNTAKRYSSIFKDQLNKPLDRAVFWVEYVIRHNGADHLRLPAEHLNFFQYFLLDVVAFLFVVGLVGLYILIRVTKLGLKKFCSKKANIDDTKKNK